MAPHVVVVMAPSTSPGRRGGTWFDLEVRSWRWPVALGLAAAIAYAPAVLPVHGHDDAVLLSRGLQVLLHAVSAWFASRLLRRWGIPGARLTALVFLLHPVVVRAVVDPASTPVLAANAAALAAGWLYLVFDDEQDRRACVAAFVLLGVAAFVHPATAVLPAVWLLVIAWDRRGLAVRPTLVSGLALLGVAVVAAGLGQGSHQAEGAAVGGAFVASSPGEAIVNGGRILWFAAAKLAGPVAVPASLPDWLTAPARPTDALFPATMIAAWVLLARRRPGAAVAIFAFCVLLTAELALSRTRGSAASDFPVLVYLAALPLFALGGAGAHAILHRRAKTTRRVVVSAGLVLAFTLAWRASVN